MTFEELPVHLFGSLFSFKQFEIICDYDDFTDGADGEVLVRRSDWGEDKNIAVL